MLGLESAPDERLLFGGEPLRFFGLVVKVKEYEQPHQGGGKPLEGRTSIATPSAP